MRPGHNPTKHEFPNFTHICKIFLGKTMMCVMLDNLICIFARCILRNKGIGRKKIQNKKIVPCHCFRVDAPGQGVALREAPGGEGVAVGRLLLVFGLNLGPILRF
jgi:hypothetical protein